MVMVFLKRFKPLAAETFLHVNKPSYIMDILFVSRQFQHISEEWFWTVPVICHVLGTFNSNTHRNDHFPQHTLKTGSLVLWELSVEGPLYLTETHWFFLWENRKLRHNGQNGTDFASKKSSKKLFLRGIWDPLVLSLEKQGSAPRWTKQKSFCF